MKLAHFTRKWDKKTLKSAFQNVFL